MKKIAFVFTLLIGNFGFSQNKGGFAYVNSQTVMESIKNTGSYKQIEEKMKKIQETFFGVLSGLDKQLKDKVADYQKKASSLNQKEREAKEEEIGVLQNELQRKNMEMNSKMQAQQEELFSPIREKISKAIKKVCEKNAYPQAIAQEAILYSDSKFDITKEVIAELKKDIK